MSQRALVGGSLRGLAAPPTLSHKAGRYLVQVLNLLAQVTFQKERGGFRKRASCL